MPLDSSTDITPQTRELLALYGELTQESRDLVTFYRELTAEAKELIALGDGYQVATAEQYSTAGADLVRVNGMIDRLKKVRLAKTRPLDRAKEIFMDLFRSPTDQLDRAKNTIKRSMIAYDQEQERLRQAEQRRQDELARRERQRLEREAAEAQLKAEERAAEQRRAAETARANAEQARLKGEHDRAAADMARAASYDRKADQVEERAAGKVEALQTTAAMVVAPVLQKETPKVSGVKGRRVWKFEVTDPAQVPREFLSVDEQKIRRYVGAMRADAKIAGVRVWDEPDLSAAKGAAEAQRDQPDLPLDSDE